jgi:protein gp37
MSSKIEWTDETWNPITGCTPISPGCERCYAKKLAEGPRLRGRFGYPADKPFRPGTLHADKLAAPLKWRKPRRVFVCSMGDLFHEDVSDEHIAAVFGVMAACPQHTFQVLTKRPEQMRAWFEWLMSFPDPFEKIINAADDEYVFGNQFFPGPNPWPLPNVWLGVTAEGQQRADERIPTLLQIPAAVRFVSVEPMLTAIDASSWWRGDVVPIVGEHRPPPGPDWVICGAENGPGARPMDLQWARDLRDQCQAAGVPFFFKGAGRGTETPPDLDIQEFPEVTP